MTRIRVMAIVAIVQLFVVGSVAFAQGPGVGRRGGPGGPGFGGPGMVLRGLNLSDAQKQQIRDITMRHREEMRNEIFALLTPDQQQQAKQLEANREAAMKRRLDQFQQRQPR